MIQWDSSENHVLLNPRLPEQEKHRLIKVLAQISGEFKGHIFIQSSGTTQTSDQRLKWIALSKEAFLIAAHSVNHYLGVTPQDRWLQLLPDFHVGGLAIWARSFLSGASVLSRSQWIVSQFVQDIEIEKVSHVSLVPAQVFDLVQRQVRCPQSIRFVLVGAGALSPSLYAQARRLGWPLLSTYGMTEMCSSVAITDLHLMNEDEFHFLRVLPHVRLRISTEGCAEIQSPALFTGYIDEQQSGEIAIVKAKSETGWFRTSDRVSFMGSHLQVLGRDSDFIKIGGESVELHRLRSLVERFKIELSISADLVLFPYPDERLGHVIHLVSDPQLSVSQFENLRARYHSHVLPFERIRSWHILPEIPRTELKKFKQSECLQLLRRDGHR